MRYYDSFGHYSDKTSARHKIAQGDHIGFLATYFRELKVNAAGELIDDPPNELLMTEKQTHTIVQTWNNSWQGAFQSLAQAHVDKNTNYYLANAPSYELKYTAIATRIALCGASLACFAYYGWNTQFTMLFLLLCICLFVWTAYTLPDMVVVYSAVNNTNIVT
jgi:hypothetical protein